MRGECKVQIFLSFIMKEKITSTPTTPTPTSSTSKTSFERNLAEATTAGRCLGSYYFILIVILHCII